VVVYAAIGIGATVTFSAERTWTRSAILAIADEKLKRWGVNPEDKSVSFGPETMAQMNSWPGGVCGPADVCRDRNCWIVHYAPLEPTLVSSKPKLSGDEYWVCIDAETGGVVGVSAAKH
jgi:hypothetical protein